jgi:hypothetical protein
MANPAWPSDLPLSFQSDGYEEDEEDVVLRSSMDVGPAKTRRQFSGNVRKISGVVVCTDTQFASFKTFFRDTCKKGSLPFDWHEHLPGGNATPATFRFLSPPKYRAKEGNMGYELNLELELLP